MAAGVGLAAADFYGLADGGTGNSGTIPGQDYISGRDRETKRSNQKRGKRQGLIEDSAVLAPRRARGQDVEELAGEAGLASGVNDEDPMVPPPRGVCLTQRLEGEESGSATTNVATRRIGDHVPGDAARQVTAVGTLADLLQSRP